MLVVCALCELPDEGHGPHRDYRQPLSLKAGDDLAGEPASEGGGLHEDQRSVHGFLCGWRALQELGRGRLLGRRERPAWARARAADSDAAIGSGPWSATLMAA